MTRENAKKQLMHIIAFLNPQLDGADIKALNMAIDALEQEPNKSEIPTSCEDAISKKESDLIDREAAKKAINCWIGSGDYRHAMPERFLYARIDELPSVQPNKSEFPTSCDDAISREDVIKLVECSGYDLQFRSDNADMCDDVRKLPSVQPSKCEECGAKAREISKYSYEQGKKDSSRKGHWIEVEKYSDGKHKIECSECGNYIFDRGHANSHNVKEKYKYCNYCGAKMDMRGVE